MTTEIKNGGQPKAVELVVPRVKAGGWLAWHKPELGFWMPIYPTYAKATDWTRHPSPLHASKEAAVEAAQAMLSGQAQGGVIKLFYVELDE